MPVEGEILGWRQIRDRPPEVLVRTRYKVAILHPLEVSEEPLRPIFTETFEWGQEWREATPYDFLPKL